MATIQYRELRRRYELDGPDQDRQASVARPWPQGTSSPRISASATWPRGSCPTGTSGSALLDPRNAGGVSLLEAGEAST